MDERVARGTHFLAKRLHILEMRREIRIFPLQGFHALDDLFCNHFPLEMADHGQRIEPRPEIFGAEAIDSFAYFAERLAFSTETQTGISQYRTRAPRDARASEIRSGTLNTSQDQVENTMASRSG